MVLSLLQEENVVSGESLHHDEARLCLQVTSVSEWENLWNVQHSLLTLHSAE